jgi:hypothetical protein
MVEIILKSCFSAASHSHMVSSHPSSHDAILVHFLCHKYPSLAQDPEMPDTPEAHRDPPSPDLCKLGLPFPPLRLISTPRPQVSPLSHLIRPISWCLTRHGIDFLALHRRHPHRTDASPHRPAWQDPLSCLITKSICGEMSGYPP